MTLCDRFTSLTPMAIRRESAREVFMLIRKLSKHSKKKNKKTKVMKPAGDNWF